MPASRLYIPKANGKQRQLPRTAKLRFGFSSSTRRQGGIPTNKVKPKARSESLLITNTASTLSRSFLGFLAVVAVKAVGRKG
ncbi:hypothetical protein [Psychromonas ingrahamii]|uniref:hypothetical protein n=1 Tax=Psychromonas ingrahamii TaxID=357794 RepID=UPI0000D80385